MQNDELLNYIHVEEIGSGSYGRVYKVAKIDDLTQDGQFYALKYFNVNCKPENIEIEILWSYFLSDFEQFPTVKMAFHEGNKYCLVSSSQ